MLNFGYTFIWTAVNLLVLYFILKKVLFKPVTEFMEKRSNSIKESLEFAEKRKNEANELHKSYEEQLKAARVEADKIIQESRDRAVREYDKVLSDARSEAESIITGGHETVDREREQMLKEVRSQVASLALAAASKVLEANVDTEDNRQLVDKFISEEGVA